MIWRTKVDRCWYYAERIDDGWRVESQWGWSIGRLMDGDIRTRRKVNALRAFIRSRTR